MPGLVADASVSAAEGLRLRVGREPVPLRTLDSLADRHRLSSCDAAHLELAMRRGLPLATLDTALLAAMPAAKVPLADGSTPS